MAPAEAPVETPTEVVGDPVAPAIPETETENPAPAEVAAPDPESAATSELQVEVVEPEKPNYITREEWEKERAEVASKAAADALESDRRRRQTENARKAAQEKREAEERIEARDTVKAAFGAAGIYEVPDDAVYTAIERVARKQAASLANSSLDTVDQAFDFIAAPAYGQQVDLDESFEPAARRLAPKIQQLIDHVRPQIEAKAREGYVAEADIPKRVEAEIARRNAKAREGQTELVRPEGAPSTSNVMSWATYMNMSEAEQLAMPEAQRRVIMAADRKARLG